MIAGKSVSAWYSIGFVSFGEAVQEGENVFWSDLVDGSITEFLDIAFNDGLVGSHRIFFEWVSWQSIQLLAALDSFMAFLLGLILLEAKKYAAVRMEECS